MFSYWTLGNRCLQGASCFTSHTHSNNWSGSLSHFWTRTHERISHDAECSISSLSLEGNFIFRSTLIDFHPQREQAVRYTWIDVLVCHKTARKKEINEQMNEWIVTWSDGSPCRSQVTVQLRSPPPGFFDGGKNESTIFFPDSITFYLYSHRDELPIYRFHQNIKERNACNIKMDSCFCQNVFLKHFIGSEPNTKWKMYFYTINKRVCLHK